MRFDASVTDANKVSLCIGVWILVGPAVQGALLAGTFLSGAL
ncbi:hypothetical protein WMF38_29750 [Sorangium sp. So ce118]